MEKPRTDRLREYRKKRDFSITAEPAPEAPHRRGKKSALEFVVQKHDATRLHYDVRIEIEGAMMSWAVPKGPSFDPSIKRLAVETEDHPMAYNEFEGRIPEGEYGAGDVIVWDRGTYETVPPDRESEMRRKGHLHVRFSGEKLKGDWHFVRTSRTQDAKNQWLMFKAKDTFANPKYDVVVARPESVISGRRATRGPTPRSRSKRSHASAQKLLDEIGEPEKATLVEGLDDAKGWRFEIKYDGYRILAAKVGSDVRLSSRKGNDWTANFRAIAEAVRALPVDEVVLDGEVCAIDAQGNSSFQELQNWMSGAAHGTSLSYAVFDLLFVDGRDVRALPLEERRELLEPLIVGGKQWTRAKGRGDKGGARGPIQLSTQVEADGRSADELLKVACAQGLEGLIAKRMGSTYVSGRTKDWLKLKCSKRQELAVVGYLPLTGTTNRVGSLLIAVAGDDHKLHFAGKVGTGYDAKARKEIAEMLDRDRVEQSDVVGAPRTRTAHFSKPKLVAEVKFTEWTSDGKIRHPSFVGLRKDKDPMECKREIEAKAPRAGAGAAALTNPDKILYPRDRITKRDVFDYLTAIAPVMVPHLIGRPLALQRYPDGVDGEAWFQQKAPAKVPEFVHTIDVGGRKHVTVDDARTLLWLGNLAALTLHQWGSHAPTLDVPDYVVFDLDPGKGTWVHLIEVATSVRRALDGLALESVVKTSGKRGLHVVVPLDPKSKPTWSAVQAFAETVADAIAGALPKIATTTRGKEARGGKLYVDALQNGRGKTIVAPYTLRALDGAPVSTPIEWSEVTTKLDPSKLGMREVLRRVEKKGDLWAPLLRPKGKLPR